MLEQGHEIVGVDYRPNQWQESVQALTIDCDLRNAADLERLPTDIDAVVHFAANARVYELVEYPDRALENMVTTYNILEFVRKNSIPRLLFASSRECYGNAGQAEYREEQADMSQCESPYTASKIAGEALVHSYRRCYDLKTIIVRFSNVYGMYDESDRVVPLFFRRCKAGEPLTIFGAEKSLDFTHVDDAVAAINLLLQNFDDTQGEIYNIATNTTTSILHLAERIKALTQSESSIEIGTSRRGEVLQYQADIRKIQAAVGYKPTILFEEGIEKAVEWYTRNT